MVLLCCYCAKYDITNDQNSAKAANCIQDIKPKNNQTSHAMAYDP